jgi:hypothetical protein
MESGKFPGDSEAAMSGENVEIVRNGARGVEPNDLEGVRGRS